MDKKSARIRRATRARRKLQELGATRLVVHRTPRHIYAQVIAPNGSEVLVAASTVEKAIAEQLKYTGNKDAAAAVGKAVAERALEKGIKDVSFDRSGFQYHGRVQALVQLMGELSTAPEEDPEISRTWATYYAPEAFYKRLHEALEELR